METKHFVKNNIGFACLYCHAIVPPHQTSSRDHCTNCLYSLHVDIYPGDRKNDCKGLLEPIGMQAKNGKQQIVYRCQKCKETVVNIVAEDDNAENLVSLSNAVWKG